MHPVHKLGALLSSEGTYARRLYISILYAAVLKRRGIGSSLGLIVVTHLEVFELVVPKDRGPDVDTGRVHVAEFARNPGHDPIHRVDFGDEQTSSRVSQ